MNTRTAKPRLAHKAYKLGSWSYHHIGLIAIVVGTLLLVTLDSDNPSALAYLFGVLLVLAGIAVGLLRAFQPPYAPLRRKLHHTARLVTFVDPTSRSRH